MNVVELIERKKRGGVFAEAEIATLVDDFSNGRIPDYQMAACLMAIWFRGMTADETVALTRAMLLSGTQLDLRSLPGPTADKHSTGGVGDKVSLLLAPLAAACGICVPMLSGRGLGHTGGTLDKLEAIPGYRVRLTSDEFLRVVRQTGCAIIGQGPDIAPADGRIYALRDVTATVDCVPLITASILSKKLAAGPESIVIDLKTGSGAFMPDLTAARALARSLVDTAAVWGRRVSVIFSDMSQPLGSAIGHAVEVIEALTALRPGGRLVAPPDLVTLTEELTAEMVLLAGIAADREAALGLVQRVWESGEAWRRCERWVAAQGGVLRPERDDLGLTVAPLAGEARAPAAGYLAAVDCRAVGNALAELGGARQTMEDPLDLTAGLLWRARLGERVEEGQTVAAILCHDRERAKRAAARIEAALRIGDQAVEPPELILERLAGPMG